MTFPRPLAEEDPKSLEAELLLAAREQKLEELDKQFIWAGIAAHLPSGPGTGSGPRAPDGAGPDHGDADASGPDPCPPDAVGPNSRTADAASRNPGGADAACATDAASRNPGGVDAARATDAASRNPGGADAAGAADAARAAGAGTAAAGVVGKGVYAILGAAVLGVVGGVVGYAALRFEPAPTARGGADAIATGAAPIAEPTATPAVRAEPTATPAARAEPTATPAVARSTPAPTPFIEEGVPTTDDTARAVPLADDERRRDPSADIKRAPKPGAGPLTNEASLLREESLLLLEARAALRSGNPSSALELLNRAHARFPDGALLQEREALSIEALSRTGQSQLAAKKAESFLHRFPRSPHAADVRRYLAR